MLSPRMAEKVIGEGHVGTRIVWVRPAGPMYNIDILCGGIRTTQRTDAKVNGTGHNSLAKETATDS